MTEAERSTLSEQKKEFLGQYKSLGMQIKRYKMQLDELRMNKMLPALVMDGMPHGSSHSDMSDYIVKIEKISQKLAKTIAEKQNILNAIAESIEEMENEQEKTLLYYRYIKCLKWEKISIEMEVSWKQVHRLHNRALKNYKIPEV